MNHRAFIGWRSLAVACIATSLFMLWCAVVAGNLGASATAVCFAVLLAGLAGLCSVAANRRKRMEQPIA